DYDPRKRDWYRAAVSAGGMVWGPPIIDVISRRPVLTLSMPVRRPDGSVAGVTGIDVTMTALLAELKLPAEWERAADAMLVLPRHVRNGTPTDLLVIARQTYRNTERDWRSPAGPEVVICEDPDALATICADAAAGRSGVRRVSRPGMDALWAYGPSREPGEPFPLVILPYETVVAPATAAERYVLDMTVAGLQVASFLLLAVAAAVAIVALVSSRRVTRPVLELAGAARRLAAGDFSARVEVRTRDEIADLGRIFNATRPPRLKGFDIAGRCVYCDETGGDYYDFLELVDLGADKLGIAVGDVTGHGIAAALLMASARGALRSQAGPMGLDLPGLFGALNRHLARDTGEGRFLTLFYGVLDGAARTLQWTSAGHDPAFWLRRASGRFEELPNTGIPLGVLDEATYGQAGPVRLASGDVVVIGTDGIWEAVDPAGEPFGKDRLRRIIALHAEAPAQQVHTAVVDAVNQFRGPAPQADDITLVVIKAL
ncbi:MAG: SpoIIE family protein phosphatase, partial [Planctomycetota bacterium]